LLSAKKFNWDVEVFQQLMEVLSQNKPG